MKPLLVLRPEPGNKATAERAATLGLLPMRCPLFTVEAVPWTAPDAASFDALLLTSANAVRHGGEQLAELRSLDVIAVGPATAVAAREAGLRLAMVGDEGIDALLDAFPGEQRLLHLAGRDHRRPNGRHTVETIIVYRSRPLPATLPEGEAVALVHSARAGTRLAQLAPRRSSIAIAAISPAAAAACGEGWAALEWVGRPDESALLALAARLCQD